MPIEPPYAPQDSVPPMGLIVLPSGLVVYEFEGKIKALGLLLPELAAKGATGTIQWVEGEEEREFLFGLRSAHNRSLNMGVLAEAVNASLEILGRRDAEGLSARLRAIVGALTATILDDQGRSSFLQVINGLATVPRRTDYSRISVAAKWGVEEFRSNVITVNHNLGVAPVNVQLTPQTAEGSTVPVTPRIIEGSKTEASFKFMLQAPIKVAAGTEVLVDWVAYS